MKGEGFKMADTDTNQETDTTQENFETSADNMGRGLSEQEVEAERIRIQEEWKKYVENSLKNNTSFNGMSDEQKAAELSSFFGVDKDGNVLLKSPHEDGGILKYSTVKNNDGTYNERISFSKEHNKGKEFNQVAADDMARTAITMGWKEIKVSNCETSAKEMIWLAVQKENLLRGTNTQITNFKPSEHSPILKQFEEFKAKQEGANKNSIEGDVPSMVQTKSEEKPETVHEKSYNKFSEEMKSRYGSSFLGDLKSDEASNSKKIASEKTIAESPFRKVADRNKNVAQYLDMSKISKAEAQKIMDSLKDLNIKYETKDSSYNGGSKVIAVTDKQGIDKISDIYKKQIQGSKFDAANSKDKTAGKVCWKEGEVNVALSCALDHFGIKHIPGLNATIINDPDGLKRLKTLCDEKAPVQKNKKKQESAEKNGVKKETPVAAKSSFLKNEDSEGTIQNPIFGPLKNGSYKETFEENLSPISKFLEKPQTQRDALQQVSKENADKRIEAEANAPKKEGYEYTNFKEFKTAVDNFKTGHKDLKNLSTKDKTELSKIINGGENFAKTTGTSLDIKHAKPRNETKSLIKAVIKVTGPLEQVKKKRNNNTPKNGG